MTERKFFAEELMVRLDELLFASPSHRALNLAASGLEALSRTQQDAVLHWARVAAITDADFAHRICMLAPQVFATVLAPQGEDEFAAWVRHGLDEFDRSGSVSASKVLEDIEGFFSANQGQGVAHLADVEARLSRLLQALGGQLNSRALTVAVGERAWTDTETIFLPASLNALADTNANRGLYKATAVLLWAQTHFGTFSVDLEAHVGLWADRQQALRWLVALEAVRLEACIGKELPGLAAEIAAVRGPWPIELAVAVDQLTAVSDVGDSLRLLDSLRDQGNAVPNLVHSGMLDPEAAMRARDVRVERNVERVRRALHVLRSSDRMRGNTAQLPQSSPEDIAPQASDLAEMLLNLPPDAHAAAESLKQDLGELPLELLQPAGEGVWQPVASADEPTVAASEGDPDYRYDEWDYHRKAYRRDWCHVYACEISGGNGGSGGNGDYVTEVRQRHAPLIRQIRRRFEALRGEDKVHRRQPEGEEIDLDTLVDAFADLRAGAESESNVFRRRVRSERSLAVMFLVDMSGSTKGWVNDAEREALVMLCEAFEALDDRYAIYGFSGWTRTRCEIYRIKSFDEVYSDEVRERIAGIEAKDYTRMGVAIRHVSRLLSAQPARHTLLVTLTDGRPDDHGDEYRGHYGIEDTRRALQEATQAGIRSYGVTIDRHGADYLKRLYGESSYSVLADVTKLPLRLAETYRRLTRS